jgi:hypothetical protein
MRRTYKEGLGWSWSWRRPFHREKMPRNFSGWAFVSSGHPVVTVVAYEPIRGPQSGPRHRNQTTFAPRGAIIVLSPAGPIALGILKHMGL